MEQVPEKISFPKMEEEILSYWQKACRITVGRLHVNYHWQRRLTFQGHILAGTIKDIVTRYAHQTGHHVTRRFGWDCHGLPIEFEIDRDLGVRTRDQVLALGVDKYNEACRGIVMRYSKEWEHIVKRMGRWIDFENDYKTMNLQYMESVWWVFKQLYDKGLVYRSFKVMPYSTACNTPLSNFEANLNYKTVQDPAVYVSFPLVDEPDVSLVAWTTTPWTLPSNLALCVHPDYDYVTILDKKRNQKLILLEDRLPALYKSESEYQVLAKVKGSALRGKRYVPLFDYFKDYSPLAFQVVNDTYVTKDSGTGVVHQAPAFGEDDFRVCTREGIVPKGCNVPCPVDANGRFAAPVNEWKGIHVKEADKDIKKALKQKGRMVHESTIEHSYPYCWRSDTPLIYKAVPSWFVAVEKIKDRLEENNKKTYWVPEFVKEHRFANWLRDARDWAVSRNRYWGTPLPIWVSDDYEEIVVVGSVKELEELSGVTGITDIHRHKIDHITIPSKKGKGVLRRVDEVFDCWFESGSMPYAQCHYPFENVELFNASFPADFIAEGLDQTRGWFYTLMVLSTALFDKPAFRNVIVNGLVLSADGKKMSKRLKNYPDPMLVVSRYGADALRLYLINSPVVRAEPLSFQEPGVSAVLKDVFLPWFNAYRFFVQNALLSNFKPDLAAVQSKLNVMDQWILSVQQSLIQFTREEMKAYRLYTVIPRLVQFVDSLTNWYVRLNRKRMKGDMGDEDRHVALTVLFEVLMNLAKMMAPFTPFFTEYMYQNLRLAFPPGHPEREDSVHYLFFPEVKKELHKPRIEEAISRMQAVIELGRNVRDTRKIPLKQPLMEAIVIHKSAEYLKDLEDLKGYILSELNVQKFTVTSDESMVHYRIVPNVDALGPKLRKDRAAVCAALEALPQEDVKAFMTNGTVSVLGHVIQLQDVQIVRDFKQPNSPAASAVAVTAPPTQDSAPVANGDAKGQEGKGGKGAKANAKGKGKEAKPKAPAKSDVKTDFEAAFTDEVIVVLDTREYPELREQGLARELTNRIQKLRKKAGLVPTDLVEAFWDVDPASSLYAALESQRPNILAVTKIPSAHARFLSPYAPVIATEKTEVGGVPVTVTLTQPHIHVNRSSLARKFADKDSNVAQALEMWVVGLRSYSAWLAELKSANKLVLQVEGRTCELVADEDVFLDLNRLVAETNK